MSDVVQCGVTVSAIGSLRERDTEADHKRDHCPATHCEAKIAVGAAPPKRCEQQGRHTNSGPRRHIGVASGQPRNGCKAGPPQTHNGWLRRETPPQHHRHQRQSHSDRLAEDVRVPQCEPRLKRDDTQRGDTGDASNVMAKHHPRSTRCEHERQCIQRRLHKDGERSATSEQKQQRWKRDWTLGRIERWRERCVARRVEKRERIGEENLEVPRPHATENSHHEQHHCDCSECDNDF